MRGSIVNRGENRFHLRQVRLDGFAESEPVRRLKKNFGDEDVASPVPVDPFDGIIRAGCGSGICPPKGLERTRQRVGHPGRTIYDEYFH
jgi:hypothetical protein